MSIVSFVVIGYHFNCLDGQLNCQAFTHSLIGRVTKLLTVQSVIVAWHRRTLVFFHFFILYLICKITSCVLLKL